MKSIWYCSSFQQEKFINNSRSKFSNNFDVDDLKSIDYGEIEVAIKNIYFDEEKIEEKSKHSLIRGRQRVYGDKVLAIRSNICGASILNCGYEKELCRFKVQKEHHFEFINPTFFKTTKDLLANATFSIIDVKTQEQPNWNIGSPTYIQAIVRSKMVDSFSIYLESDDKNSINNETNTNMNFTIDLPQRQLLHEWEVCLKSIILPCRIWNIYEEAMPRWSFRSNLNILEGQGVEFVFPQGSYEVEDILALIQKGLDTFKVPVEVTFNHDRKRVTLKLKRKNLRKREYCTLFFNEYLNKILGFTVKGAPRRHDLTRKINSIEAYYTPNIHAYTPKCIIVTSDIVDETVFGGERVKLLKVIPNKMEENGDVLQYEFLQDEYVNLGTHEFDRIQISICDVTGENLKVDYREIPTRLQLEFRKPRSLKQYIHM